ncbi:MAG: hypothetical protein ABIN58_13665, partial [candidate division WOR-3 bacterium]
VLLLAVGGWYAYAFLTQESSSRFDGKRAYADVKAQMEFGSRAPGTVKHSSCSVRRCWPSGKIFMLRT